MRRGNPAERPIRAPVTGQWQITGQWQDSLLICFDMTSNPFEQKERNDEWGHVGI